MSYRKDICLKEGGKKGWNCGRHCSLTAFLGDGAQKQTEVNAI